MNIDRKMIALNESELATVSGAKMSGPSFKGKLTAVVNSPVSVTGVNVTEIGAGSRLPWQRGRGARAGQLEQRLDRLADRLARAIGGDQGSAAGSGRALVVVCADRSPERLAGASCHEAPSYLRLRHSGRRVGSRFALAPLGGPAVSFALSNRLSGVD